jgi:hypothetical protein
MGDTSSISFISFLDNCPVFQVYFLLPLIFTLIAYHFVAVNVTSDICQIKHIRLQCCQQPKTIVLPTQTDLDHFVFYFSALYSLTKD